MTNRRLYEIMDRLGMIGSEDADLAGATEVMDNRTSSEYFEQETANDLISTMNFVDNLTTWNDLETIKKLLVAIIMENK